MTHRLVIFLTLLVTIGGASWYYFYNNANAQGPDGQNQQKQKASVSYIEIQPADINLTDRLPGRVVAYQTAEIRPQVSGIIQSRLFEEGSYVKEGQQLYQIDPARYEADYQIAQANLQNAQAKARNAQNLADRFEKLIDYNAVSQQEYDDAQAGLDQANAEVALAEAELKNAKINLDYTKVYSPISGFISPSNVTKGALVTAEQGTPLATVRQLDPVYVDLSQTTTEARKLQERLTASRLQNNKAEYEVTLFFGNTHKTYSYKGKLDATDLAVDPQTGTIRLRSVFPNPDKMLLPGMFVSASIEDLGQSKKIIVPQKSVSIEPDGTKAVWLVNPDNKAEKRAIETGESYKKNWVVLDGLRPGERVIVTGRMMLQEGAELNPSPAEADFSQTGNEEEKSSVQEPAPQSESSEQEPAEKQNTER